MSYPVNRPYRAPAGGQWQQPPQYQPPWGVPPEPQPPRRTGLVVTLVVAGVVALVGGGVGTWLLLSDEDDVPPSEPAPVHIGVGPQDLTPPETLEDGALVLDPAGHQPEGAVVAVYKAPGFFEEQVTLIIYAGHQARLDDIAAEGGENHREDNAICRFERDTEISCTALLDAGYFVATFEETTAEESPVPHPENLEEAMRRTEDYLAEAQA